MKNANSETKKRSSSAAATTTMQPQTKEVQIENEILKEGYGKIDMTRKLTIMPYLLMAFAKR